MAVRFSPKISGMNARIFGTIFGQSETEFSNYYWTCVLVLCVVAGKMNKILVV